MNWQHLLFAVVALLAIGVIVGELWRKREAIGRALRGPAADLEPEDRAAHWGRVHREADRRRPFQDSREARRATGRRS